MEFNKSNRFNNEDQNKNLIHYKGKIGEFYYDPDIWEICKSEIYDRSYLHLKNVHTKNIELPKGLNSCYKMFFNCKLSVNFTLGDNFDTSNITDMENMFCNCTMPKKFSLGKNFDTSKVFNMENMFYNCLLSENFSLGEKFDTSKVKHMYSMFAYCILPNKFDLGKNFNISSLTDINNMFYKCKFSFEFAQKYKDLILKSQQQ